MSYAPLDDSTPYSSVNLGGGPTVLAVWCLILASKDQDGVTSMTPEGAYALWLGSREPRPLEDIQAAWDFLAGPDPRSKNREHDGRRIIPTEDGRWFVVSHHKYREKYREEVRRRQWAQAQKKARDTKKQAQEESPATPQETPSTAVVAVVPPICFDPPIPPKPRGNPTVAACCDIWNERYGKKSAVGGKIAGAISPLLGEYTHEEITNALRRYLAETNHPNPDPNNFREHFGDWLPLGKGAGRTPIKAVVRDVTEENRQALREIQKEREGK